MTTIRVKRGAGERQGADIVESLLDNTVLIHRGRAEMNAHAHQFTTTTIDTLYRDGVRLGQLVGVVDPVNPVPYKAKVTGIRIHSEGSLVEHQLNLERPR